MRTARIDPIRQLTPLIGEKRRQAERVHADLDRRLAELDRQQRLLSRERRSILLERRELRRRLFVNLARRGRRALADGADALPPLPAAATWLYGRRLRLMCLSILQRCGPLPLGQLHAELHRLGYGVDHRHAVKALADALGYEVELGRVRRVARGVYRCEAGVRVRAAG